ncbi:MAG: 4Fe-4S binding protein [Bacteroidales bacterium]|nr:4Fe-4S binding protein [Bacteroidales bacterium]
MINNSTLKIAIASGKGGTGKTFIATNLYITLQQKGYETTLVDCDAEEPNDMIFFESIKETSYDITQKVPVIDESKCTYCSRCQEYCNYNAIFILPPSKIINVIEDLCHGCGACSVACRFDAITEKDIVLGTVTSFERTKKSRIIEARTRVGGCSPGSHGNDWISPR